MICSSRITLLQRVGASCGFMASCRNREKHCKRDRVRACRMIAGSAAWALWGGDPLVGMLNQIPYFPSQCVVWCGVFTGVK